MQMKLHTVGEHFIEQFSLWIQLFSKITVSHIYTHTVFVFVKMNMISKALNVCDLIQFKLSIHLFKNITATLNKKYLAILLQIENMKTAYTHTHIVDYPVHVGYKCISSTCKETHNVQHITAHAIFYSKKIYLLL